MDVKSWSDGGADMLDVGVQVLVLGGRLFFCLVSVQLSFLVVVEVGWICWFVLSVAGEIAPSTAVVCSCSGGVVDVMHVCAPLSRP